MYKQWGDSQREMGVGRRKRAKGVDKWGWKETTLGNGHMMLCAMMLC